MEHASTLLEWIWRRETYLFTEGSILQEEEAPTAEGI